MKGPAPPFSSQICRSSSVAPVAMTLEVLNKSNHSCISEDFRLKAGIV